jgi:hypothetical protein
MRAWIISPILSAALIALVISSAEARGGGGSHHGGRAGGVHMRAASPTFSRHVFASRGRFVIVSNSRSRHRALVFDRFSRRFVAFRHRGFGQFGQSIPFGSVDGFGGFGSFGDIGSPAVISEAPPGLGVIEPQPAPLRSVAELPPCHETTPVGVVIERGTACSRVAHRIDALTAALRPCRDLERGAPPAAARAVSRFMAMTGLSPPRS